jgi:hypothetical protein
MRRSRTLDEIAETDRVFAQKLDLQGELDQLKESESRYLRCWLNLSGAEKSKFGSGIRTGKAGKASKTGQLVSGVDQPPSGSVRLANELGQLPSVSDSRLIRLKRLSSNYHKYLEKLEIEIDWREQDGPLADSFLRLVKWMRKYRGKAAFEVEHRGPKSLQIDSRLFALAVWRCSKFGMNNSEIWRALAPLRNQVALGARNRRNLGKFRNYIEELISYK